MNYVILDLEMCMVKGSNIRKMHGEKNEIIQIGAVMLDEKQQMVDEFSSYVKPEYGKIDSFIEKLTGIGQECVEEAPNLRAVLMHFATWIADREVTVLSWSDSDYYQLQNEMRVKKIKHHKIQDLLDGWVDFQHSFDQMLGLKKQYALEDALNISRIQLTGRAHDGLCDAYNTAKLFAKLHRQTAFQFELVPICQYEESGKRLSFTIGELFTPELLAQINDSLVAAEPSSDLRKDHHWSIWRKAYGFLKGQVAASDENWNKICFSHEMRKLDFMDGFKKLSICDILKVIGYGGSPVCQKE